MRKFFCKIGLYIIILFIIDNALGFLMPSVESVSGNSNYYCLYNNNEDILILGSSYGKRNIDPSIICRESNYTCYNASEAGNGIICAWARYKFWVETNKPKLIIFTATPSFDYLKTDEYSKYLSILKPWANHESVKYLFKVFGDKSESVKLGANMYRYNTKWIHESFRGLFPKNLAGFDPIYTCIDTMSVNPEMEEYTYMTDTLKLHLLELFYKDIKRKGIPVCCVYTPLYSNKSVTKYNHTNDSLCRKYDIPIIDHTNLKEICEHSEFFGDQHHLNYDGAQAYSKLLIEDILSKGIINQKNP